MTELEKEIENDIVSMVFATKFNEQFFNAQSKKNSVNFHIRSEVFKLIIVVARWLLFLNVPKISSLNGCECSESLFTSNGLDIVVMNHHVNSVIMTLDDNTD